MKIKQRKRQALTYQAVCTNITAQCASGRVQAYNVQVYFNRHRHVTRHRVVDGDEQMALADAHMSRISLLAERDALAAKPAEAEADKAAADENSDTERHEENERKTRALAVRRLISEASRLAEKVALLRRKVAFLSPGRVATAMATQAGTLQAKVNRYLRVANANEPSATVIQ